MSGRATEIVFLPGFDGAAPLRDEFVGALARDLPARSVGYPNRALGSLDGYWRHAASAVAPDSRLVVIGESFSGLVAARWAANDSRVAGLVLCGAFARNPTLVAARLGAAMPSAAKVLALKVLDPLLSLRGETRGHSWSRALPAVLRELHRDVIGERLRLIARENVGADLSALRIPVVLVQFDDDLVIRRPARRHLESVCHNARIVRLPGPHFALETRPLQCAQAIAASIAPFFDGTRNE